MAMNSIRISDGDFDAKQTWLKQARRRAKLICGQDRLFLALGRVNKRALRFGSLKE